MVDKDIEILTKIPDFEYSEKTEDSAEVLKAFRSVIYSRRSVRVYNGTPIPESIMRDCLEIATMAPSSSNLQPWEFYWVRSPEKKQKLVEACLSQPAAKTAAEIVVCVARTDLWRGRCDQMLEHFKRVEEKGTKIPDSAKMYYSKIIPLANTMGPMSVFGKLKSVAAFFVGLRRPIPREPTSHSQLITWAVKSTALACENLMLAFRAHGFDSCPMEGLDSARVKQILGLGAGAHIVMAISAGKRASNGVYGPRIRFPINQTVKEV